MTISLQCAFEARISGAEVVYILIKTLDKNIKKILSLLQVETLNGFDKNSYKQLMFSNTLDCHLYSQRSKENAINMIKIMNL